MNKNKLATLFSLIILITSILISPSLVLADELSNQQTENPVSASLQSDLQSSSDEIPDPSNENSVSNESTDSTNSEENDVTAANGVETPTPTAEETSNPRITYNANGGTNSGILKNDQITLNGSYTIGSVGTGTGELNFIAPNPSSQIFDGWNTSADGTGDSYGDLAEVSNLSAEQDGKITLYAQWSLNVDYTVLEVHNSTLSIGETWTPKDNFDYAKDSKNSNIDFKSINVSGTVNTNIAGTYNVTYSYDGIEKIATITVIDKKASLIPILRSYNPNDGDHLYTASQEEYDWITGLKWNAEGTAFQSVLSDYEDAVPVYRLYNSNSGEHFYTISEKEYDGVAEKGWTKEQVGFYMVSKEKGDAVYRVFNPNATGPGSHLYTSSREEADWLIDLGWRDEGIAFYSAK